MATRSLYRCSNCAYEAPRRLGKCPHCDEWNTMVEALPMGPEKTRAGRERKATPALEWQLLAEIPMLGEDRQATGLGELDRVLGGGLVPGSYIILGAEPGAGKSTLATQILTIFSQRGLSVAMVSGEESPRQVRMRFERLGAGNPRIQITQELEIEQIIAACRAEPPDLLVIDSVQSIHSSESNSTPGSVTQIRECGQQLVEVAKDLGTTVLLIGQVTKEGALAGPRALEHVVDVVLSIEGDSDQQLRILRAVKNRFGSTDEVGVFEMTSTGLLEVEDPSALFVSQREKPVAGSIVCATLEGTRPMLVEVQALCNSSAFPQPIRAAHGINPKRLQMLLAVLTRKLHYSLGTQDVFLNLGGGINVSEPAIDLAVCLAVASAASGRAAKEGVVAFGEVSLMGEIRKVPQSDRRRQEALRLGYDQVIDPSLTPTLEGAIELALEPDEES